jgi:hypothetical protein
MAQTGFTPILIYSSSTAAAAPDVGNLTNSTLGSELAINITDGKLFYKDNANAIQVIAWKVTPTTAGGTGLTSYTAGDLLFYASGTALSKLAIGASGRYLSSSGSAPQWTAPAALTKTDDTNVTLTLGGSASTALLNAASLTLGWTGTLATTRGGTGLSSFTANGVVYASSTSALATGSSLTFDGTNLGVGASPTFYSGRLAVGGHIAIATGNSLKLWNTGGTGLATLTSTGTNGLTIAASGNTTLSDGNLIIGTSGKGIDFSATPGTGTSELLNDYEEGTWTPGNSAMTVNSGSWAATGTYTKIGRTVFYSVVQTSGTVSAASGVGMINGFPFAPARGVSCTYTNSAGTLAGVGLLETNSVFYGATTFASQTALRFSGSYEV